MKSLRYFMVLISLTILSTCGDEKGTSPPDETSDMEPLGEGVRWKSPEINQLETKPTVRKVPVPEISMPHFNSLGVAYEIELEDVEL